MTKRAFVAVVGDQVKFDALSGLASSCNAQWLAVGGDCDASELTGLVDELVWSAESSSVAAVVVSPTYTDPIKKYERSLYPALLAMLIRTPRNGLVPVFRSREILRAGNSVQGAEWQSRLLTPHGWGWDPFAFVDLCQAAARSDDPVLVQLAQAIQREEMRLLLGQTYADAAGW